MSWGAHIRCMGAMCRIRCARPTMAFFSGSFSNSPSSSSGSVHQQAVVCISSSGSVTGPQPRFSWVSKRIFLNRVTMLLTSTSPRARTMLVPSPSDSNSSSTFRLVVRSASV